MSEGENVKVEWQNGQRRVHRWVKFRQDNQRRFTVLRNREELDDEQLAAYAPQS